MRPSIVERRGARRGLHAGSSPARDVDRDFDGIIAVHLTGGFLASRHALPAMLAQG